MISRNVPKLRFGGFDEVWKRKHVNELASKLKVGFVGTCEPFYTDSLNGILLVRTGNLKGVDIVLDDEKYVTQEFHIKNKKSQIYPGDLLLARHGGNGEICLVPENFPEANCLNIVILRTNLELNAVFFQLAYSAFSIQKQIRASTAGSTQGVINTAEIGKLEVIYPTLPEQQKIATFLTAVDEKTQQLSRKKELLEQYKKGVMQQLFSGKLRFKPARPAGGDEDGKDFGDWEEKKLGEIARITTGSSNRQDSNLDGEYTFFDRSQDIRSSNIFLFDTEAIIVPGEGQEFIPKYFIGKFDLHQRTYAIMDFGSNSGKFLYFYISYNSNHLNSHAVGSTVKSLRLPMFEKMPIKLPSTKEQQKIANFLSNIDTKIQNTNQQITQMQSFKKGLLQQMFI